MNNKSATRGQGPISVSNQTEYQVYSLWTNHDTSKIIDWTEHKLKKILLNVFDFQQKIVLSKLLTDYKAGKIAIAWKSSKPVYIKVIKDA